MAKAERQVLIAGGGIGGLATSIALARRNIDCAVLERSSFEDETGAGIQLGPNATRRLRTLGAFDAIEPAAVRPDAIWLFDGLNGRKLASLPLGDAAEARYGAPYVTLHRTDLHAGLLSVCKALAPVRLKPGVAVTEIEPVDGAVAATGSGGTKMEGSSLIGADGLWSMVRSFVAPGASLRFAGATASRALLPARTLPAPFDASVVGLWLGPGAHLVHYPVRGGEALNVVAVTEGGGERQGWNQPADAEALLSGFTRWCKESKSLLEQAHAWRSWSLYRLAPLPRWSAGAVALMGDAAHPVLPFLAQGAALAVEDAAALAESLDAHRSDAATAFRLYEASRRGRARHVQTLSRRYGWLYHLRGPLRLARNLVLARSDHAAALRRLDWLYGDTAVS